MKLFGLNILCFVYSFPLFCQCGGYIDNKFKADSCYKVGLFQEASNYYRTCLTYNEKQRLDYYYLACTLIKINRKDSVLYFYKITAKQGLHYAALKDFYADTVFQKVSNEKQWRRALSTVKRNTEKYVSKQSPYSGLLKELLKRKIEDQKYRGAERNLLSDTFNIKKNLLLIAV